MYFPKQMLVLLIWVPILVQSQNQERCNRKNRQDCLGWANKGECERTPEFMHTNCRKSCNLCDVITGCSDNSQCGNTRICYRGRCVADPCSPNQCPTNTRCVALREGQAECQPIPECNDNSHCGNAGLCDRGTCVSDPCAAARCGTNTKCVALRGGQVECQPIPGFSASCRDSNPSCSGWAARGECQSHKVFMDDNCKSSCNKCPAGLVSDRDINQGVGVSGNTQSISQGGSISGSSQGGNQAGDTQGVNQANQGSLAQGANQNAAAQGGSQEGGSGAVSIRCNDKSHCNDNEICEKEKCVNPCDEIQCGQGASCKVFVDGTIARPQCICPAGTTGSPFVKCAPFQDSNRNNANQPTPGTERPAAPVLGCKINSQCVANKRCQSGSCVDPCVLVKCGKGAVCQVAQRQGRCVCPAGTVGNPRQQCMPKSGCNDNSQCGAAGICDRGICVADPCAAVRCGTSTRCVALAGGQVECQPIPGNAASVTQKPASVTTPPASTSVTNSDISFPGERNQTGPVQAPGKRTRDPGCETDPDPGECRGAFPRYYFNKAKDQCDCFLFGGCDIEGVRFTWTTFDECLKTCEPGNTSKGSGCKRVSVDEVTAFLEEQRRNREKNGR